MVVICLTLLFRAVSTASLGVPRADPASRPDDDNPRPEEEALDVDETGRTVRGACGPAATAAGALVGARGGWCGRGGQGCLGRSAMVRCPSLSPSFGVSASSRVLAWITSGLARAHARARSRRARSFLGDRKCVCVCNCANRRALCGAGIASGGRVRRSERPGDGNLACTACEDGNASARCPDSWISLEAKCFGAFRLSLPSFRACACASRAPSASEIQSSAPMLVCVYSPIPVRASIVSFGD